MRAMFLIASKGRPEFKSWNTISARFSFQLTIVLFLQIFFNIVHLNILSFRFRTFLGRALTFDPDQRATAEELLKDPFITRLDNMLKNKAIMMFFIFLSDLLIDKTLSCIFLIHFNSHKGSFHLRFSGIRPLRGGGTPLFSLMKKTFFYSH